MAWLGDYVWVHNQAVRAGLYRGYLVGNIFYLHGVQSGQEEIVTNSDTSVSHQIDDGIRCDYNDGDALDIEIPCEDADQPGGVALVLRTGGGVSDDPVWRTRVRRDSDGNAIAVMDWKSSGSLPYINELWPYAVGVLSGTPTLAFTSGKLAFNRSLTGATYRVEVDGHFGATEYEGLQGWPLIATGHISHYGEAQVDGQWILNAASGPPLTLPEGSPEIANLNVPLLEGYTWPAAQDGNSSSVDIDAVSSDFSVAATTAHKDGTYDIVGEMDIEIGSGDTGVTFTASMTGAVDTVDVEASVSGEYVHLTIYGTASLNASDTIELLVQKDSGSVITANSSTASGSILANWTGGL